MELFLNDIIEIFGMTEDRLNKYIHENEITTVKRDNMTWYQAKCLGSDFDFIIEFRFKKGRCNRIWLRRTIEDYEKHNVFELFEQSQRLIIDYFGEPTTSEKDTKTNTIRDTWIKNGVRVNHNIVERFMLYEVLSIHKTKQSKQKS